MINPFKMTMETIWWIIGMGALGIFVLVVLANWAMLAMSADTHRFHSQVPLVGALSGVAGFALIPVPMPHCSMYLLSIFLDCGTIMLLAALPSLAKAMFSAPMSKKDCPLRRCHKCSESTVKDVTPPKMRPVQK